MLSELLKFCHLAGLALLAGGLIGVFLADLRAREAETLPVLAEAARMMAVFYDGVVVPGALLLAGSGTWLIIEVHGGWAFLDQPWLAGMVALFLFEFIEGNTITRRAFMQLRRLSQAALAVGQVTPELAAVRRQMVPTFTHFLDLPLVMLIISLGVVRPATWDHFAAGMAAALTVATGLTLLLPRLYRRSCIPADGRTGGTMVGLVLTHDKGCRAGLDPPQ